jgi:alkylmercury lyase
MENPTLSEIIAAWQARQQSRELETLRPCVQAIQLLAQGQPVSIDQFRTGSHLSETEITTYLARLKKCGGEFDENGNLIGNMLTLSPSPHRLQINGRALFAWCALDTLFLPAYLQQAAQVTSICPATKIPIHLTITPEGIERVDPATTVVAVVVPGVTPSCDLQAQAGPQGPVCPSMHFFRSGEAAIPWLEANPGIVLLSLDEAWQLAYTVFIEPLSELK